ELIRVGVASLKIEGRLKSPEYVASITRVYRGALDRALREIESGGEVAGAGTGGADRNALQSGRQAKDRYELEMSFSRGLYTGWFRGIDNQKLAHGRFGTKRGVFVGTIDHVASDSVTLTPLAPLKAGDGVVFDAGTPENREEGGRVYQVEMRGTQATLRFGQGDIDFRRIRAGNRLWKTNDPALDRDVRATFSGDKV
ncbi:MAG TPA: U32 family peptidase, partial [Opitutaceae bacterium]|nr:U32 family peptidase [Opitutaceae bacterium]